MPGIKDRVAIIGMGCSKFGERWDAGRADLLVESCSEAFEDAGVGAEDIQAAWLGVQNGPISGQILAMALKLDYIPISRVENFCATGTDALRNACFAVAAGAYDLVLVAGVEKLKDSPFTGLVGGGPAMIDTGVTPPVPPPVQFALAATRYAHHYGMTIDELKRGLARISVKNHHNGAMNPKAHFQREITLEQVLNAPPVAWPLGLFDCCGVSDGSAAAIITTPELAKNFKHKDDYLLVKGIGLAIGHGEGMLEDDFGFVSFPESVRAAQVAYEEAGIKEPFKEIDHAEVHDCFSITENIIYEDLDFCPRGKGKEYVESGVFDLDGELAVNPDGGLKCFGHPIGASGIRMIYEVYLQLQGRAGPRQRKNPTIGLTHNLGGRPGSFSCAVGIFGQKN